MMTKDPGVAAPVQDGTVERDGGRRTLRFQRHFRYPQQQVWAALTVPEQLADWLASAERLDLIEGGHIELHWQNTDEDGNSAVMQGVINRLEPPSVLEWESDIHGLVRWELHRANTGCVLNFSSEPPAPDDALPKMLAGWHVHLDLLADALAGHPVDWSRWPFDRWAEQRDKYAEQLG